jgi:hypothetical protein
MAFLMELDQSGCMALAKTKTIFQWPYWSIWTSGFSQNKDGVFQCIALFLKLQHLWHIVAS